MSPCQLHGWMQPVSEFGRLYAVYGGVFIVLSYLWGWALDGDRPDKGAVFICVGIGELLPFGDNVMTNCWPNYVTFMLEQGA